MTSTSFNVGLHDAKNSSRVIKPPGGGHTDIFGIHDDTDLVTPSKRKNIPATTITSCFQEEEKPKEQPNNNLEKEINEKNGNIVDENVEPIQETKEEENKKEPEPPKKVRVPPGGFSTRLW